MSSLIRNIGRPLTRFSTATASSAKSFDSIPGPPIQPGYGTSAHFGQRLQTVGWGKVASSYYHEYGSILKHQFPIGSDVWIFDPEAAIEGFRQEGQYPTNGGTEAWAFRAAGEERKRVSKWTLQGEAWYTLRKAMQKDMFSPAVAESYLPLLDEPVRLISKQFPKATNIDEATPYAAMDMFFSVMFGWNPKTILGINQNKEGLANPKDLEFAKNSVNALSYGAKISIDPRNSPQNPGPDYPAFQEVYAKTVEQGDEYFHTIMKNAAEKIAAAESGASTEPLPYFFRVMARGEITQEEAATELTALLFAGVDTTHHVLLWAIFNLARYPDKQEILRQELNKVLGDGPLEGKHLKSLSYLTQCLRESHRLTPPGPFTTARRLPQTGVVGGYTIPKETRITFNFSAIQNDSKYVEQPTEFIPERWAPQAVASRKGTEKEILDHKLLAKPFGYGQRMCVGARVAEGEIKALLARLVRDYRFEWSPKKQDYELVLGTMLRAHPFPKLSWIKV